jgi:preprotein translocase SecF subunit
VFNLVGKRYLFILISLVVIVPGVISLLFKGLNVGIDFRGGTTVELRPDRTISAPAVNNLLKPINLESLEVLTGSNTSLPGNQTVWVRLNTQIDTNVQGTIQKDLQTAYGQQLSVLFSDLTLNGKTITVVTVTKFNKTPTISDIEKALATLPNTSNPAKGPAGPVVASTPTVSPTGTPTATGTGTPNATATATATAKATPTTAKSTPTPAATPTVGKGTATPAATPTVGTGTATPATSPTATPTSSSNPADIPVKWVDVRQGTTTQTITLQTLSVVSPEALLKIQSTILNNGNTYVQVLDNASVTGSVAAQTTQNAFLAVVAASVFILLYVWFSFRRVPKPWRYGACAIIALLHDVLVVVGIFSILGWAFHIQINALFITALLTVVGFSVHDTIVVFDRIRENMQRRTSETFEQVVNASLVQTMARSLNTSLTVLITLSALTLFGGVSIRDFTLTLLIGIFSGTYSSIFNASMLLVIWEKGELGFSRLRRGGGPPAGSRREEREFARSRG